MVGRVKTIVVLGMHRSGSSSLARALGLLGAEMGPVAHLGRTWENKALRSVNTRILEAGNGAWDTPPTEDDWLDHVPIEGLPEFAKERVVEEFGEAELAVWKDPRTCLTLPFWRSVLGEDNIAIVFVYRHPYETARSLETRNTTGNGASFALWERHNRDALRYAKGLPTVVLGYGDLSARPRGAMSEVWTQLKRWGFDLPNDPAKTPLELQQSGRQHAADISDANLELATPAQRALLATMRALDGAYDSFEPPTDLPPPNPLSVEVLDTLNKLRRLRKRAESAEAPATATRRPHKSGGGSDKAAKKERKRAARAASAGASAGIDQATDDLFTAADAVEVATTAETPTAPAKQATAKKTTATKITATKAAPTKKPTAKKTTAKKTAAKKTTAKTTTAKKAPAKRIAAKKTTSTAKSTATKKTAAKKTASKATTSKRTTAAKTATAASESD